MDAFQIEFDPRKAVENRRKHGVRLAEAEHVLYDDMALRVEDPDHPEQRFRVLGRDGTGRLLVVVYTYREPNVIRLISARHATRRETDQYQNG
ncbi:BrnT family toxin [Pseudomonas sp. LRF_L74]|uniref:BrnT family toxin n=1 Tax=Pseudomonas sp. LRF_L74 TaxID=3369422 RepID=UPI003F5F86D4